MHLGAKHKKKLVDEINITPLTDVFLVLLIIMIVVTPMMKLTQKLQLPEIEGGDKVEQAKLIVEVTQDGKFFVDGVETPGDVNALADALKKGRDKIPGDDKWLLVQADRYAKSKATLLLLEAAREAEFKRLTIGVSSIHPRNSKLPALGAAPATPATPAPPAAPAQPGGTS
jgi:biopolymer transport protein ExbD